jgi:PepSY-associated TM region
MGKKKSKKAIRLSYLWHRRIGVLLSIPILVLAITGLILNNSKLFKLDKIYITNQAILSWYGMTPKSQPKTIQVNDLWVTELDGIAYVNDNVIAEDVTDLTGAGNFEKTIVFSTTDAIFLIYKKSKRLIEKLGSEALPPGKILTCLTINDRLHIDTTSGQFSFNSDLTEFYPEDRSALPSPKFSQLPKQIYEKILEDWRGRGLSLWRILLDIHDGTFFGKIGSWLADISAVAIVLLVFSGIFNWRKRPFN